MLWTVSTFLFFTALVAVISWWKTRGDNLDTAEGYFLAGRGCLASLSQVRCC